MARINSTGLNEVLESIVQEQKATPETMRHMIEAAGDVYVEETRNQIKEMKIFDTGATWWSIKRGKSTKAGDGVRLEVWPAGTRVDKNHPDGERVETIAFVTEYGTKRRKARPFMSNAAKIAAPKAEQAMLEVWERESEL